VFHFKLLELESELMARELAEKQVDMSADCQALLIYVENLIGIKLADPVPNKWRGWLTYRRNKSSLVVSRGRAFKEDSIFAKTIAGLDIVNGLDQANDYRRHFDVSPPPELDHLLINFADTSPFRLQVWYGENFAPYQLYFQTDADLSSDQILNDAVAEGCVWILKKPKGQVLKDYLANSNHATP
jgi:hypothetical protein